MNPLRAIRALLKSALRVSPHPILDGADGAARDGEAAVIYDRAITGSFLQNDEAYVRARFRESVRERTVLEKVVGKDRLRRSRILDVGGGNGAFELALASAGYFVVSLESLWSPTVAQLVSSGQFRIKRVVARAEQAPFKDSSFDVVTCHDAVEHFRNPSAVGNSLMEVATSGALIFITTAARLRYLLRRDPHYSIRFLVALPSRWQQRVARWRGYSELYHTERIYWSARGIARLFPNSRIELVLSRWKLLQHYLFDEIVLSKPSPPTTKS